MRKSLFKKFFRFYYLSFTLSNKAEHTKNERNFARRNFFVTLPDRKYNWRYFVTFQLESINFAKSFGKNMHNTVERSKTFFHTKHYGEKSCKEIPTTLKFSRNLMKKSFLFAVRKHTIKNSSLINRQIEKNLKIPLTFRENFNGIAIPRPPFKLPCRSHNKNSYNSIPVMWSKLRCIVNYTIRNCCVAIFATLKQQFVFSSATLCFLLFSCNESAEKFEIFRRKFKNLKRFNSL